VVDTLPDGFTVGSTLGCGLLPVSPPDSNSVDEITLLGLVTQSPSFVGSRRSACSVDDGELSVFPTSDSGDELEDVRLLLCVELLEVFVGTHLVTVSALVDVYWVIGYLLSTACLLTDERREAYLDTRQGRETGEQK
jgi:hypothetical protein